LWPALEKALALKTFAGKEKILDAFVHFTKAAKAVWEKDSSLAAQMNKIAIREAKRNNDAYRPHAFAALGIYSETRTDIDMFDEVHNIVLPMLEELADEDKMDTTDDTKSGGKSEEAATITAGVSALFRAINVHDLDPSPLTHLPKIILVIKVVLPSSKVTVATRLTLYERMKVLFDGLGKRVHSKRSSTCEVALELFALLELSSGSGTEIMRTKRGEAAEAIVKALDANVFGAPTDARAACKEKMKEVVGEGLLHERSQGVKVIFQRVLTALKG
jgi:proteasome component ECM29